jgi:hypothetical protein
MEGFPAEIRQAYADTRARVNLEERVGALPRSGK